MARLLPDWIDGYMEWTAGSEAPDSYHRWIGMSVLCAAMGKNFMNGTTKINISNNLFVLIIADQGFTRKTAALRLGRKLLIELDPIVQISADSASAASFGEQISLSGKTNPKDECNFFVWSHELHGLVNTSRADTFDNLMTMYDVNDRFVHQTKGGGKEIALNPHISLLAATTSQYIRSAFDKDVRETGMMSRIIMITEKNPRFMDPIYTPGTEAMKTKLVHDLHNVANQPVGTQIFFDDESFSAYSKIYSKRPLYEERANNPLSRSFIARMDLHIQKVCAACAISRDSLLIEMQDFDRAMSFLRPVQTGLGTIYSMLGQDPNAPIKAALEGWVKQEGRVREQDVFDKFLKDIDYNMMINILNQMVAAGKFARTAGYLVPIVEPEEPDLF